MTRMMTRMTRQVAVRVALSLTAQSRERRYAAQVTIVLAFTPDKIGLCSSVARCTAQKSLESTKLYPDYYSRQPPH